jgi:hypothetical protein
VVSEISKWQLELRPTITQKLEPAIDYRVASLSIKNSKHQKTNNKQAPITEIQNPKQKEPRDSE